MNSDFNDVRYLYYYGEYVSENEKRTAMHLNELPLETIQKMADVYTEGYRIGFVNTGKRSVEESGSQYPLYAWVRAGESRKR